MKNHTNQQRSSVLAKFLRCAFAILCVPLLLLSAHAAFVPVDTFESLGYANLGGQGGWTVNNSTCIVTNDPADPGNRVIRITNTAVNVYKSMVLPEGATGTLFFRFRMEGPKNFSIGMTDVAAPAASAFGDFEPMINMNTDTNNLGVRDGANTLLTGNLASDTWYYCWMVINNAADNVAVYVTAENRDGTAGDQRSSGATTLFGFRNGQTNNNLLNFNIKTAGAGTGTEGQTGFLYVDDVFFDATGQNLQNIALLPSAPWVLAQRQANAVQLSWTRGAKADTYNVKRATTPGGPYVTIANTTANSLLDEAAVYGGTYYYVVSGVNVAGEGVNSLEVMAKPGPALITSVVETGGDYPTETNDTVQAAWTGMIITNWVETEYPTNRPYAVSSFGENVRAFTDRNHTWRGTNTTPTPTYLLGGDYIAPGNDNRDNTNYVLDITLAAPAIVYICVDNRVGDGADANPPNFATNMTWMTTNGFVATANGLNRSNRTDLPDEMYQDNDGNFSIEDEYSIYVKTLPAGIFQTYQADAPSRGIYLVVAKEALPAPALQFVRKDGALQLSWPAVTGATNYNIKRSTTAGGPYTLITNVATASYMDQGLVNGTTYYYMINATSAIGEGFYSPPYLDTPNVGPASVTAAWTNGTIEVTWPEVTGALSYNVYRSLTAGGPYASLTTTNATTNYVDTTFTNGVTWYYMVTANFAAGQGANSPEASAQTPPAIVMQPADTSVPQGSTISLSVAAVGTGTITYQWIHAGTNWPGATSANLSIANAVTNNSGPYTVIVGNNIGSVTSQVANVTVLLIPVLVVQPPAQSFFTNTELASISVFVSGQAPFSYFWQKFDGVNWLPVVTDDPGQPQSFTQFSWDLVEAGDYRVVITNDVGAATSAVATVTVVMPIELTTVPAATNVVVAPATATFTAAATGNLLYYQWYKDGGVIVNATNTTYTIATTTPGSQGNYTVVVTNLFFAVTSAPSFLDMQFAPAITTQPANQSVTYGASAVFFVSVTADPAASYQWQLNEINIPDATNFSHTIASAQASDVGGYRVIATNPHGSVTSSVARLFATPPADYLVTFNSSSDTNLFYINEAAPFPTLPSMVHATAGGIGNSGALDWAVNSSTNDANANFTTPFDFTKPGTIIGMSAMIKVKQATTAQRFIQLGLVNDATSRFNDSANMTWTSVRFNATSTSTSIDSQFRYQNKFSTATGFSDGPLATMMNVNQTMRVISGHWYKVVGFFQNIGNGNCQVWGSVIYYGNSPNTTFPGTVIFNFGPTVVANPAICSDTSVYVGLRGADNTGTDLLDEFAIYTGFVPPYIGQAPQSQAVLPGQPATFRVGVDGTAFIPAFQWYANGVAIPDATNILYKTPYTTAAMNGTLYNVVVTTSAGSVTSSLARLTVIGTDSVNPTVVSAGSIDPSVVGVAFSETMAASLANNPANFTVNGVPPRKATLQSDARSVRLDLADPLPPGVFTVTVNNLTDIAGNPLGSVTTNGTLWAQDHFGWDVGYPLVAGQSDFSAGPGWIDLSAGGGDIFGNNDSAYYFMRPMAGDFDLKVRIQDNIRVPGEAIVGDTAGRTEGSKMGLTIRDSLAFGARHVLMNSFPAANTQYYPAGNNYQAAWRQPLVTSGSATLTTLGGVNNVVTYPNSWVRLRRVGDTISTYISTNGVDWVAFAAPVVISNLPPTAYVGLAGCARANVSGIEYKGIGYFRDYGLFVNPAAVVSIPTITGTTTVADTSNLVLTAAATVTGAPTSELQYNWQRSADSGASWLAVLGRNATNAILTNLAVKAWQENGAQYRVVASAGGVFATSLVATVTVTDANGLRFLAASNYPGQYNGVVLSFSEAPSLATATDPANFTVTNASGVIPVTNIQVLAQDPTKVVLTFDRDLAAAVTNTVVVANLKDRANNNLTGNITTNFALVALPGPVVIEQYTSMTGIGNQAADLQNNPRFATAQYNTLIYSNIFGYATNIPTIADNYALRLRAYFVPPANGNFRFFLRSDDSSRLFMNTNAVGSENAEAVSLMAWNAGGSSTFGADGFRVSPYVTLVAGQKYYLEAWMVEGTGNEGIGVMWRQSTVTTTPVNGENILAANLAPVVGPITVASVSPLNPTVSPLYGPLTLKAVGVHGAGPYYVQWYRNGQPISGANSFSYTIANPASENGAVYAIRVANDFSYAEASTTLAVQADTNPLQIVTVAPSRWMDAVTLTFNQPLTPAAAYNATNYTLDGRLSLRAIDELSADGRTVTLRTTEHQEAAVYTVTAFGIATNFQAYMTVRGYLSASLFYEIDGGVVGNLLTLPKFIANQPDTNFIVQGFSAAPANLDRYGGRVSGWFSPLFGGNYQFYVTADDGGHLYLNTNSTGSFLAEGKSLVGKSDFGNRDYYDLTAGTPRYSERIPMVAGQKYYIEGLWKEGTGGDFIRAAVRGPVDFSRPLFISEFAPGPWFVFPVHPSQLTAVNLTTPLQDVTTTAGSRIPLVPAATAVDTRAALTYLWQQSDGSGGFTNLPGAYSASYVTPPLVAGATQYRVLIYSPSGMTNSVATVTAMAGAAADTTAPALLGSTPQPDGKLITLTFTEPMRAAAANTLANYRLTDSYGVPVQVASAVLLSDGTNVQIYTAPMQPGSFYNMTITNLADLAGNPLPDTAYTFLAPNGVYARKRYNIQTPSLPALMNSPAWTNDAWAEYTFPNVLDLGSIADNYGLRLFGYIVPDRTGNHIFYLATDDQGEFWLSTNASPDNLRLLAIEQSNDAAQRNWTGAGTGRTLNPATGRYYNTSSNIWLQMGQPYYFEIFMREATGGDNAGLAWQRPGDPTPVNGNATFAINSPNLSLALVRGTAGVVNPVVSIVTNEAAQVTLRPIYTGQPMGYQWLQNGVPIGTGGISANYTTPPLHGNAQYSVVVWSPQGGSVTSTPTAITISTDPTAPAVLWVDGGYRGTPDYFMVSFSEPVSSATANNAANYTITGATNSIGVAQAALQPNGRDVLLRLAALPVEGAAYTVSVANVADLAAAPNTMAATNVTAIAWSFTTNFVYQEIYTNLAGNVMPDLTNAYIYLANQPSITRYTNVASINGIADFYGFVMRGYYLPPTNGDYSFYLQHDDAGMLRLSTNGALNGVRTVIEQAAVASAYANGGNSFTNSNTLAGVRYYFEVLGKEGTGGDYFNLGVQARGVVPAAHLSGAQMGVYTPPVFIAQQPASTNIMESRTATFAVVANVPTNLAAMTAYQWRSNGVDIAGATNAIYTTPPLPGQPPINYSVAVSVFGTAPAVSSDAVVTIAQDNAPPMPVFAGSLDGQTIYLQFDEMVYPGTDLGGDPGAQDPSLYWINYNADGLPENFVNGDVVSAVLLPDGRTLRLTLWAPMPNRQFMVRSYGVLDLTTRNFSYGEMIAGVNQGFQSVDMGLGGGTMMGVSSNYMTAPNGITVKADGADIWTANDGGNFLYREVLGNFDVSVQVASLFRADVWTKAGLMARIDTNSSSFYVSMFSTPNPTPALTAQNTFTAQWRDQGYPASRSSGDELGGLRPFLATYPDNWVRLKRVGNEIMAGYSFNGVDWIWHWTNRTVVAQSASGKFLVGLATTSHTTAAQTTAEYRNLYFPMPPAITVQPSPVNLTANPGGSVTLSGLATNPANSGALVYQWRKNNLPVAGASSASLVLTNLGTADSGMYVLAAGNDGGEVWSAPVMLTVNNQAPVLGADLVASTPGVVARFPVGNLFTNDMDPDGTPLTLVGVYRQPRMLFYDFNSGLPTNTTIANNALVDVAGGVGGSGVLKLHPASGNVSGIFIIDDPALTNLVVNEFTLDCKLFIGAGSATPADGMAFAFGADITPSTPVGAAEDGIGSGLSICIDNYNSGNNEAPAFDVKYAGVFIARIPIPTIRQTDYVDFHIRLDADGTLDVAYAGSIVVTNLPTGFVPAKGRFAIAGRTGGSFEAHWVDDLRITVDSLGTPLGGDVALAAGEVIYTPAPGACGADTFYYAMTDGQANGLIFQAVTITMPETNAIPPSFVVGLTNQTLPADTNYQAALPDLRGQVLATDNCSILSLAQTPAPGALLPLGDTTVTLIATDGIGLTATNEAVVTVVPTTAPTITAQPTNVTISLGGTATFSVTANGGLPVTYQWLLNGTNLDGATSATLVITNAQVANAGTYSVAVSNSFNGLISDAVVLTVITTPPTAGSPQFGAGAFSVKVGSVIGRTYVLQYTEEFKLNMAETVWTDLPGVAGTGAEITLTDPAATAPRRYYRIAVQ